LLIGITYTSYTCGTCYRRRFSAVAPFPNR
jgi:hypothetical protein